MLAASAGTASAQVLLVDDSATGLDNGLTWSNAFEALDSALAAANAGDTILVAHGTYFPKVPRDPADPRSRSFALQGDVTVVGGYLGLDAGPNGGSSNPTAPDGSPRLTVLSGSIGVPTPADDAYNVVHAPAITGAQRLERVTITGGNADGAAIDPSIDYQVNGGGLYSARLAGSGGGKIRIDTCLFQKNAADESGGAVFFAGLNSFDQFFGATRCLVESNVAGKRGGGFYLDQLGAEFTGSQDLGSYVMNCSFFDNEAGGTATDLKSASGGAVWVEGLSSQFTFQMSNNRVVGNNVRGRGAAYAFGEGAFGGVEVANDTIYDNTVTETDGGAELPAAVAFVGTNTSFTFFRNNIVFGNRGASSPSSPSGVINLFESGGPGGSANVTSNDIELAAGGSMYPGTPANINADPLFVDAMLLDFRLQAGSPCIDAGDTAAVNLDLPDFNNNGAVMDPLPVDFRGSATFPRVVNTVDMGAFEQ